MKIQKNRAIIYCYFFIILVCGCGHSNSAISENRQLLKEYAFSKCLFYASNDSLFFWDDPSISAYQEIAQYSPEAYAIIDSFARKYTFTIKPSEIADHEGKKLILMQCFLFYKSPALDSLIKSLDKEVIKGW